MPKTTVRILTFVILAAWAAGQPSAQAGQEAASPATARPVPSATSDAAAAPGWNPDVTGSAIGVAQTSDAAWTGQGDFSQGGGDAGGGQGGQSSIVVLGYLGGNGALIETGAGLADPTPVPGGPAEDSNSDGGDFGGGDGGGDFAA